MIKASLHLCMKCEWQAKMWHIIKFQITERDNNHVKSLWIKPWLVHKSYNFALCVVFLGNVKRSNLRILKPTKWEISLYIHECMYDATMNGFRNFSNISNSIQVNTQWLNSILKGLSTLRVLSSILYADNFYVFHCWLLIDMIRIKIIAKFSFNVLLFIKYIIKLAYYLIIFICTNEFLAWKWPVLK